MTLQAAGTATAIDYSSVNDPNGTILWTSNDNTTSAFEHHWTANGVTANEVVAPAFSGYTNDGAPPTSGFFSVQVSHLDMDLDDGSGDPPPGSGLPDPKDEDESDTGVGMPITYDGPDLPATFPPGDGSGRILGVNINSADGGTLYFEGTGNQLAVYRTGLLGSGWEKVTTGISVPPGGLYEAFMVHTSNQFTGPVMLKARLEHATTALDAADVVKVVYEEPALVDIDVDSNNNGIIAGSNRLTEDEYEALDPGKVIPVTKWATAVLKVTPTAGTVTLSSTLPGSVLKVANQSGGEVLTLPKTWNLNAGETVPTSLILTALALDDDPATELGQGNITRTGQLTLTHTAADATVNSDVVSVTLVLPVSQSPQNNRAVSWEPYTYFQVAGPKAEVHTNPLKYTWTRFRDQLTFPKVQWDSEQHRRLVWDTVEDLPYHPGEILRGFKHLGERGLMVVESHGTREPQHGMAVIWRSMEADIKGFLGLGPMDPFPANTFSKPNRYNLDDAESPMGFHFSVTPTWTAANWKGDRDGARSIAFLMACFTAESINGGESFIDASGGTETFGYNGVCDSADHTAHLGKLLGRMDGSLDAAKLRSAGPAFDAGGFAVNQRTGLMNFRRSTATSARYWTTLCPAALLVVDNAGVVGTGGKRIGFGGFVLDTERDTSYPADQTIVKTAGNGTLPSGVYSIQPAWGSGFEFKLDPGQTLQLKTDRTKVVGDGSTDKLYMDIDRVTPNDSDHTWNLMN